MRRGLAALAIVLGLFAVGGAVLFQFYTSTVTGPGPLNEAVTVVIEPGDGLNRITSRLTEANVIDQPYVFRLKSYVDGLSRSLKAGEYAFEPGVPMEDVLSTIANHDVVLHTLTVPEGWTSIQIADLLNRAPLLSGPPVGDIPEGSLLPETYTFPKDKDRAALLRIMRDDHDALLDRLWMNRADDLPLNSPEEAVILASIVERETGIAEERGLVASVFLNRLRRGMRLQSDPTVIYGLTGGEGLDRPLTRSDLQSETPYNTYVINGLPPEPICHPGRASLEAVLQPEASDYIFFVADGSGGHAFARTLDEHNRNVRAWRRHRAGQR